MNLPPTRYSNRQRVQKNESEKHVFTYILLLDYSNEIPKSFYKFGNIFGVKTGPKSLKTATFGVFSLQYYHAVVFINVIFHLVFFNCILLKKCFFILVIIFAPIPWKIDLSLGQLYHITIKTVTCLYNNNCIFVFLALTVLTWLGLFVSFCVFYVLQCCFHVKVRLYVLILYRFF